MLIAIAMYAIVRSKNKFQYSGVLIAPVLFIFCNRYHLDAGNLYLVKIFYPITLFLLLQSIIFVNSRYAAHETPVLMGMAVLLLYG